MFYYPQYLYLNSIVSLSPLYNMMKFFSRLTMGSALAMCAASVSAQTSAANVSCDTTITSIINKSGVITVTHPEALELRLRKAVADSDSLPAEGALHKTGRVKKMGGYRVQIYSDNNARTAKNEARAKERAILGAYPELSTYVIYDSPYWRLRVGDCRSKADAEELAAELKKAFPAYKAEITVVRDRINAVD